MHHFGVFDILCAAIFLCIYLGKVRVVEFYN